MIINKYIIRKIGNKRTSEGKGKTGEHPSNKADCSSGQGLVDKHTPEYLNWYVLFFYFQQHSFCIWSPRIHILHRPSSADAPNPRTSWSWSSSSTSSPRIHTLLLLPTLDRLQIRGESAVWKAAQPACILFLCVKLVFEITMTLLCFFSSTFRLF